MKINFFPCGVGEFILIRDNGVSLAIDSGFQRTYRSLIKPQLLELDIINLWVLTHTDEDHIGGLVKMINDQDEQLLQDKVNEVWFNHSSLEVQGEDDGISVRQGMLLRDKLLSLNLISGQEIWNENEPTFIGDIRINILSPNLQKLQESKIQWNHVEERMIASYSDYNIPIEILLEREFIEDNSVWNGGSIAILVTKGDKRIMLLADSHPSVIIKSLQTAPFNCTKDSPLRLDCVKVAHHGSKSNTCYELLELIECRDWVFCADGSNHGFPHKECMVSIINHYKERDQPTRLILNHSTPSYDQIFGVDKDAKKRFNFEVIHLDDGPYDL